MAQSTQDPFFTVIVTTFDRADLLDEALTSVLQQSEADWECIVVDDASPAAPKLPADARFRLVRQATNRGVAAARNRGLAEARGRALTFLDDDDRWLPDRLAIARLGLRSAPIALCQSADWHGRALPTRDLQGDVASCILDGMTPQVGRVAVMRTACPDFNESYATVEDVDWWLRTARASMVCTVQRPGWASRAHDGPRHGTGTSQRIADSERLLAEHASYFAAHRRARAFRHYRIGVMAEQLRDHRRARTAFSRSLQAMPSLRASWHLAKVTGGEVPVHLRRALMRN